jgi:murein DD-endopeptidase MepM/ murein hydrolase activator NlpD
MTYTRRLAIIVAAILAVALLSGYLVGTAAAAGNQIQVNKYDDEIAKANKEKAKREAALEKLEDELKHTEKAIVEANSKLAELESQLPALQREFEAAQERVDAAILQQAIVADKLEAAEAQDRAITAEIDADNLRIAELEETVAALARDAYKGAGNQANLGVVFGSQTSREFVDDYAMQHSASRAQANALAEMEQIAAVNRNRGARQEAVREYIVELKVIADELVEETRAAKDVAALKKAKVEALLEEVREVRAFLETKKAQALAKQRQFEAEQKDIEKKLRELIKKKIESERPKDAGNPRPVGSGTLSFPTAVPYITSSYGYRTHPIYGYRLLHQGTDFRAYSGTAILAARDGRVEWAKWTGGFGNHVMLDHGFVNGNALNSSYAHLSSYAVSQGQYVTRGQVIGYSGTTGNSTAAHLHFETYVNGNTVNPMSLLGPLP